MGSISTLSRLVKISSGTCHYCFCKTNRVENHPRQATKEHVFPRAFGGANNISNYVLACSDCNNKRGTLLFYCECDVCTTIINKALSNPENVRRMFDGIIEHNRVKVLRQDNMWVARRGHVRRHFPTWAAAMDYAHNGTFQKGK